MSATRRERSKPSPLRNGLLMLALALLFWVFFTPCERHSVTLYLPPLLFGLLRGIRRARSNWRLRAMAVGVYGLVFLALIGTAMLLAGAPPSALIQAAVLVLLMMPLGLVGYAVGEELAGRLLPGQTTDAG